MEERAVAACQAYERWASEVARLTEAISDEECPHEAHGDESDGYYEAPSCFSEAKTQLCGGDFGDKGLSDRPITLKEIEVTVSGCESCTRLVGFIRDRKEAKKRLGVVKRQIRATGKAIIIGDDK